MAGGAGGGVADWTEGEKAQIRSALGIDGLKIAAAGGDIQTAMRRAFAALISNFGIRSTAELAKLQQVQTGTD